MPVTINDEGNENRPWEVYRVETNSYNETKVVRIEKDYSHDNDIYFILELDETTGLYTKVATIQKEIDVKPFILKNYLGW